MSSSGQCVGGSRGVFGEFGEFHGRKPRLQLTVYSSPSKQKKQTLETQLILPSTGAYIVPLRRLVAVSLASDFSLRSFVAMLSDDDPSSGRQFVSRQASGRSFARSAVWVYREEAAFFAAAMRRWPQPFRNHSAARNCGVIFWRPQRPGGSRARAGL